MSGNLLLPILFPALCAAVVYFIPKQLRDPVAVGAAAINFILAVMLFGQNLTYTLPWAGFGIDFSLRLYSFSAFILLAVAGFTLLLALYSSVLGEGRMHFYFFLTAALSAGAVLSNNLVLLLFFWEGLLLTLFGMIIIGRPEAYKTAVKAFIIVGIADIIMMVGIILTGYLAHTFTISEISLPLTKLSGLAFILLMTGAIAKAGSMPFHFWIPDAAIDAPLPFMAFLPGALEKLLGIYFLTRITLDLFKLTPGSPLSYLLMTIGAVTILTAVILALLQKNYKKLLSYHAISQVGYMILGVGTMVPAGIVGGLFHMINNALYKSGLFLTAGAVEKAAGSAELKDLGGLRLKMPVTFACFFILALSISGVPPFNGFFSKELIYEGALERGWIFYFAALLGSFFTAASFLKLGYAVYAGKPKNGKEVHPGMLLPMIVIAFTCVLFGILNYLPLNYLIQPVLGERLEGHSFSGMPSNFLLTLGTLFVLAAAFFYHKKYAPAMAAVYANLSHLPVDIYRWTLRAVDLLSLFLWRLDRTVDDVYEILIVKIAGFFADWSKKAHTGNFSVYVIWSLFGAAAIVFFSLR